MSLARKLITEEMGLKEGSLDGKEWKKVVKEEVTTALVCHLRHVILGSVDSRANERADV